MPEPYDPRTGIAWDTRLSGTEISVYFYPAGQVITTPEATYTSTPFNAYQQSRFEAALALYSNITKLTFTSAQTPEAAPIRFFQADLPVTEDGTNLLGFAFPPATVGVSGLEGYNSAAPGWSNAPGGTLESGGNAFTTLIHEMGHGFGLAHPHDNGGGSTIFPGVVQTGPASYTTGQYQLNQGVYTMMSYNDGWFEGPAGLPDKTDLYGEQGTPMAFDVAVLQQKYGANTTYRTGDDTYQLVGQNGVGTAYDCIWDAGGNNAITYDGPSDATIDLRPATLRFEEGGGGWISYVHGVRGGYTIAAGVSIRTAVSGDGNDLLTANDQGCMLQAGGGQNTISGGAGNDTIVSAGTDLIATGGGQNLVTLGTGASTVSAGGQDTIVAGAGAALVGINGGGPGLVFGGGGALTFVNGGSSSTVVGGAGSATVFGGTGGGVLAGGRGGQNVMVSGTGAATLFGGGDGDVVFAQGSGQLIVAGSGNETLSGASASGGNVFFTGSGNAVVGGGAGADVMFAGSGRSTLIGGAGADQFVFRNGAGGGQAFVGDFSTADGDKIVLQGYGAGAAQAALSSARTAGGATILTLGDNTVITVAGPLRAGDVV